VRLRCDVAAVGERHERAADERVELVVSQSRVGLLDVAGRRADLLEGREELLLEDPLNDLDREVRVDRVRALAERGQSGSKNPVFAWVLVASTNPARRNCSSGQPSMR
jgi:hypothetical protein